MKKLSRKFYLSRDTPSLARDLLGKLLVVPGDDGRRISGMIVETEAYMGHYDRAAHSFGGRRTARNNVSYGVGGHAYIYFIYGMYHQLNIVTGPADHPHGVLIRAIEPVEGIDAMRLRRGDMKDTNLTSGPGKLCIALDLDRDRNGEDLLGENIYIERYKRFKDEEVAVGKRIGIDFAGEDAERLLRFWVSGNPFVSRK